jgi:hypothetical protein
MVSNSLCWQRGQTLRAEGFQKELFAQLAAAQFRPHNSAWSVCWGPASESCLRRLADTLRSLARQLRELLLLILEYVPDALAPAVRKARAAGASGGDYIPSAERFQHIEFLPFH